MTSPQTVTSPQAAPQSEVLPAIAPQTVYENLSLLEQVDEPMSALYRERAQDVLGDTQVQLGVRIAIAERLNQANHLLELGTVSGNDSY